MRTMGGSRGRRRIARAVSLLVSGLLLWAAMGVAVNADSPNKIFQATVNQNGSMVAGGTYGAGANTLVSSGPTYTGSYTPVLITFTNSYASAAIQAVQLTVPTGITVLGTPTATWTTSGGSTQPPTAPTVSTTGYRVMEWDNVYITTTTSLTVTINAVAECFPSGTPYDWNARAKQSNSFNGDPGNDFNETTPTTSSISGTCSLAFDAQPKDAIKNTNITSQPLTPTAPGVQVGIYDGSGTAHVVWWESNITLTRNNAAPTVALSGYTSAAPGATGVATFINSSGQGPTLATSASGYTLTATTSLIATTAFSYTSLGTQLSSTSTSFVVVDDGQLCTDGSPCSSHSNNGKLDAQVNSPAQTGSGEVLVSISPATLTSFDCAGYTETTDTVDFNLLATAPRSKTVQVTIYGGLKTQASNKWQACFRAPYSFVQRDGTNTTLGGDGFSYGLLPDCSTKTPPGVVPPCILQRLPNNTTKDMVLVLAVRPGDPGVKF